MSPARALALLLAVGGCPAAGCHQPTQPAVPPPPGPIDPTNDVAPYAGDDTTDASIVNDASPKLDAATVGLDSGTPLR